MQIKFENDGWRVLAHRKHILIEGEKVCKYLFTSLGQW